MEVTKMAMWSRQEWQKASLAPTVDSSTKPRKSSTLFYLYSFILPQVISKQVSFYLAGILSSHPPRYSWNIIEHPPCYSWNIIEHPPRYSWNIIEHPPRYSWNIIEPSTSLQLDYYRAIHLVTVGLLSSRPPRYSWAIIETSTSL